MSSIRNNEKNICLCREDITKMDVDCIVNAANSTLLGGGGVDGAIHRAAGPGLLDECRTLHGCRTGEAKITKGYRLQAKYVIHTVGPRYGIDEPSLLEDCYRNCMNLAGENQISSIAFPAISTGVYHYPKEKAAEIAAKTVSQWLMEHPENRITVYFTYTDAENYQLMEKILASF